MILKTVAHRCSTQFVLKSSARLKRSLKYHSTSELIMRAGLATMSNQSPIREGILLGMGNPLLDMTVVRGGVDLLVKYKLDANNAVLASPQQLAIFKEIVDKYSPTYIAGGATQNSVRVAQWLLGKHWATTFLGSAADDMYKHILEDSAHGVGVNVQYQIYPGEHTGVCAAIITGENRSLITELGAASKFCPSFLHKPDIWALVEAAQFYYVGGFLLTVSPEAVLEVSKHSSLQNKVCSSNLHAPFLCKHFADPKLGLLQYIDLLFGNGDEAREFAKEAGLGRSREVMDDVKEIALKTAALPKANPSRPRIVIFTQGGKKPIVLATQGEVREFPVTALDPADIKDTNGCGDAFVGGFLAQLVQGKSLDDCLRCGAYASKVVIQHYGCTFPPHPDFV
ncbi:adenosine kinase [Plakobranchus ocellatus]|uniref:Adenosine kinase n=1 Tax=Plakobranchus ocellatus TaxID=259542 RepID=A0AAV4DL36_9GAST|nr:adenosine kinase [Plakobranchus ocellatus]